MWRKEDGNPQPSPEVSPQSSSTVTGKSSAPSTAPPLSQKAPACISQGIKIKGELAGTEDLFIDGTIEGKITLASSSVTVGPNGTVKADISAREIVLRGLAEGKFTAEERIQIWSTARVQGELTSERISIEDGAELRGRVEAGKSAGNVLTRSKKLDANKSTDQTAKGTNPVPGAATAGAD